MSTSQPLLSHRPYFHLIFHKSHPIMTTFALSLDLTEATFRLQGMPMTLLNSMSSQAFHSIPSFYSFFYPYYEPFNPMSSTFHGNSCTSSSLVMGHFFFRSLKVILVAGLHYLPCSYITTYIQVPQFKYLEVLPYL